MMTMLLMIQGLEKPALRIYPLVNADAENVVAWVRAISPHQATWKLAADMRTNSVIVKTSPNHIERLTRIIKAIDDSTHVGTVRPWMHRKRKH